MYVPVTHVFLLVPVLLLSDAILLLLLVRLQCYLLLLSVLFVIGYRMAQFVAVVHFT